MSVKQNYGVLRLVGRRQARGRQSQHHQPASAVTLAGLSGDETVVWLPDDQFVYILSRRENSIGRALDNDIILMDPTVSREHARLVLGEDGWHLYNITDNNMVYINGCHVPIGGHQKLYPQDFLLLGNTLLQFVAPDTQVVLEQSPLKDNQMYEVIGEKQIAAHSLLELENENLSMPINGNGHRSMRFAPQITHPEINPGRYQTSEIPETPAINDKQETIKPEMQTPAHIFTDYAFSLSPAEKNLIWQPETSSTMQFAWSYRLDRRVRRILISFVFIVLISTIGGIFLLNNLGGLSPLVQISAANVLAVLTIPIIPAFGINLLVNFIDRFEREPWFLRLAAFLWGAIIAIPSAAFIEHFIDGIVSNWGGTDPHLALHFLFKGLDAGITEETVKGLGLLLLFIALRDEFDNVTDGIVYGALIGAGFAMVENFTYVAANSKDLLSLILGRIVLGWLCHSTFTVCFGAALGYIRHTRIRWQHITIPFLGYLLAIVLHTGFDFVNSLARDFFFTYSDNSSMNSFVLTAIVCNYIPPFIAQIVIVYVLMKSLAHEAALIREFLVEEVCTGIVTVDEYALLQHSFARTKIERQILWTQGFKQWLRVKALYQTEIGLAFRKWHVKMDDRPHLGYLHSIEAYRQRIQRLRLEIERRG